MNFDLRHAYGLSFTPRILGALAATVSGLSGGSIKG
jgi:hypothetical protein